MKTVLYLLRHGATDANLAEPARLQGRKHNPSLTRLGVRQAESTRDFLAIRPIDVCYSSPMLRAFQTAAIIAAPHGLSPQPVEALTECDIGRWEGMDWQQIRYLDADAYWRFHADPAANPYPGGESFQDVYDRAAPALEEMLERHAGQALLVVAHHIVNRTLLAGLLGLPISKAKQVSLDNCGISVIVRDEKGTSVSTLNATFHLHGVAAA